MPAPQRRPGPQSPRGDVTGRDRERLAAENADAVAAREAEIGMISHASQRVTDEGIIDIEPGQAPELDMSSLSTATRDAVVEASRVGGAERVTGFREEHVQGEENVGTTADYDVTALPEEARALDPNNVKSYNDSQLNEKVLVRALFSQEDVTVGYGNTFDIEESRRYRLPRWVAMHLEEKGLVLPLSA